MEAPRSDRVNQLLIKLRTDLAKLDKLYIQLMRSVRIRELWPEAFAEECTCSPRLNATNWSAYSTIPRGQKRYPAPYDSVQTIHRAYLRRSDGVEFDLSSDEFFSIFAYAEAPK